MKGDTHMSNQIVQQGGASVKTTIERYAAPYATVAKEMLHVSPDLLRAAIISGELPSHIKPLTRGRTPGAKRENVSVWVKVDDAKAWFDSWPDGRSAFT